MAATRRPAPDSAARCPPDAMTSGNCNCPPWGGVYLTADYGDGRNGMRAIFEGVDDGRDAFATGAGLEHDILVKLGTSLEAGDWPLRSLPLRNICAVYVTIG